MKQFLKIGLHMIWALYAMPVCAQQSITLGDAINIAQRNSYDAMLAKFSFTSSYWAYKSFRAELLPSLTLNGGLMNFNHSRVEARNAEDGKINYVDNNSLTNSLTLSMTQQISSLGGTLSLQSYLYRLDQFDYKLTTYNSRPLRLSYSQPLRNYNELKWRKKTEPKQYEKAKKVYLEAMEDISIRVTALYFQAISSQSDYQQNVTKYKRLAGTVSTLRAQVEVGHHHQERLVATGIVAAEYTSRGEQCQGQERR